MIFVTGNKRKVEETKLILGMDFDQNDIDPPEIQSMDCEEVARESAKYVMNKIQEPFFLEDGGLYIEALNGFPGAFLKSTLHTIGNKGIVKLMEGEENRRAVAKLALAYWDGKELRVFIGECQGQISKELRGETLFGFDQIFIPEGHDKTFAEDMEYKHKVSHRRKALEKLKNCL